MKKEYNKTTKILMILLFLSFLIIFLKDMGLSKTESRYVTEVLGTGSMLPSITPDTKLLNKDFDGNLRCGHVYIYKKFDNSTDRVVHRFVYEDNEGNIYMKGDNNLDYDKPINKSQIIREVVGYRWDDEQKTPQFKKPKR